MCSVMGKQHEIVRHVRDIAPEQQKIVCCEVIGEEKGSGEEKGYGDGKKSDDEETAIDDDQANMTYWETNANDDGNWESVMASVKHCGSGIVNDTERDQHQYHLALGTKSERDPCPSKIWKVSDLTLPDGMETVLGP